MGDNYQMISNQRSIDLAGKKQEVFDYFAKTHGLVLTDSEMDDIINIVITHLGNNVRAI
jgi:hypothetical protein